MGEPIPRDAVYLTSYCNHPHRLHDGKPVGHECYIIPPNALLSERAGDVDGAIAIIQAAKRWSIHEGGLALRRHRGVKPCKSH